MLFAHSFQNTWQFKYPGGAVRPPACASVFPITMHTFVALYVSCLILYRDHDANKQKRVRPKLSVWPQWPIGQDHSGARDAAITSLGFEEYVRCADVV